jgi:molybdopterin molybdotransferase
MAHPQLISVDEAQRLIFPLAAPRPRHLRPLDSALGHVLGESVVSHEDSPPFDKSLVDGCAVRACDVSRVGGELRVLESITAGEVPSRRIVAGTTSRVMTGAPIPEGADAVVMCEYVESVPPDSGRETVRIGAAEIRVGQHILRRGESIRRGEAALPAGRQLRPVDIGVLAALGVELVSVVDRPSVAIIATGSELMPESSQLGPAQIHNSNGPMLRALLGQLASRVNDLGIGPDSETVLESLIQRGLESDVLLLSGGVSAGTHDLVPGVLERLGVKRVFHKVNLKPGKPLWFGSIDSNGVNRLVFGLPGNPVSTLVCFELFVRPALMRMCGVADASPRCGRARLTADLLGRTDRLSFLPARHFELEGEAAVERVPWKGSADLFGLSQANCLIRVPRGEYRLAAGQCVDVLWL